MEFYFNSPKLKMGGPARFFARLVTYITYGALVASTTVLIFAELRWMQSLGVIIILFLIDRLFHIDEAERKFGNKRITSSRINLDYYLSPPAMSVLEKASEKAVFIGGNLKLWIKKQCLEKQEVKKKLKRADVSWKELDKRINEQLKSDHRRYSKKEALAELEEIVIKSAEIAIENKREFITPEEIWKMC